MSAPLELYGLHFATCTKRVETVLKFHNYPYEFRQVNIRAGEQKTPEYLKLQPFGKIPALRHGDFTLFESRAIARYIDNLASATSGKRLVPKEDEANGQKRALVEQWISADHDNFSPALAVVVIEKFHWHRPEENQELIKVNQDKLEGFFNILDAHFAKNQYFVGDEITFADISPLPWLDLYYRIGGEFTAAIDSRPNLSAWFKRVSAFPAWQEVLAAATPIA